MVFRPRHADVERTYLNRSRTTHFGSWTTGTWCREALAPAFCRSYDVERVVDEALRLAGEADRLEIALDRIGKVLANATGDADGTWPTATVRDVIERIGRSELDDGFRVQILNSRGVQARGVDEGGDRERERAGHYIQLAELVRDGSPRTAAALRGVAASYLAEARYLTSRSSDSLVGSGAEPRRDPSLLQEIST